MGKKIPHKSTIRALDAVAFMNWQYGIAFNGLVTINFSQLGLTKPKSIKDAVRALNESISGLIDRYATHWKLPAAHFYLYVHEDVATSHGHHLHELMVMPRGLGANFDKWLRAWATRNFGDGVPVEATNYKGRHYTGIQDRAKNQSRLVRYILKSTEDCCIRSVDVEPTTLHTILQVDRHPRAYCADVRRMVGTSQNLGVREQLWEGFAPVPCLELVLTEHFLEGHQRSLEGQRFQESLERLHLLNT